MAKPITMQKKQKHESVLTRLEKTLDKYWNISPETGGFLRLLAELKKSKNILEVGTSNGYSGIFLALAAKKNNGKFTTLECDWNRAAMARQNLIDAGVMKYSEIIIGEARDLTKRLKGKFDFVFIDANKDQYLEYLKNIEKNLKKGSVVVADNVISHKKSMGPYVRYVTNPKRYDSSLVLIGSGEMVSVKK